MRYIKYILIFIILILAGLGLIFTQYKDIASQKIKEALEKEGLKVSDLHIERLDDTGAKISNLSIGNETQLKFKNINATYDIADAINGHIKTLSVDKIEIDLHKSKNVWAIGGIEDMPNNSDSTKPDFSQFIPEDVSVKEIIINAKQDDISLSTNASIKLTNDKITKQLTGTITAPINISTPSFSIAMLLLEAKITSDFKKLSSNFTLKDNANSIHVDAEISTDFNDIKNGKLLIKYAQFPFSGGIISAKNISSNLSFNKAVALNVTLKNVELAELFAKITNGEISGSGKLNGTIPVVYYPDGTLEIKEGYVDSHEEGIITVSPILIPGDNAQIQIARTVLQNFHYENLRISLSSDKSNKSNINLSIEGRNPDYIDGKKVKLNVNLSGDTIPMIQQSLLPINDVTKLINKGNRNEQ